MANPVVLKAVLKQEVEENNSIFQHPRASVFVGFTPPSKFKSSGRRPARGVRSYVSVSGGGGGGGVNLKFNTFYRSKHKTF